MFMRRSLAAREVYVRLAGLTVESSPCSLSWMTTAANNTQRRLFQATLPLYELKMSKRRLRPKHKPSLGFSVPVCIVAVLFTIYLIISIKTGSFDKAVYAKRTFF